MADSITQHEGTQRELRVAKETIRTLVSENQRLRSENARLTAALRAPLFAATSEREAA